MKLSNDVIGAACSERTEHLTASVINELQIFSEVFSHRLWSHFTIMLLIAQGPSTGCHFAARKRSGLIQSFRCVNSFAPERYLLDQRNFLFQPRRNSINGTVIKSWCGLAPLRSRRIYGRHIPQVSSVLTADRVISMELVQLLFRLSGDQMAVVPELHCTFIGDTL